MSDFSQAINDIGNDEAGRAAMQVVAGIFENWFNLLLWLFIPILALFTWVFNRKSGLNYAENLVLQTFLLSLGNILCIVFLLDLFVPTPYVFITYYFISLGYYVYGYKRFFQKSWGRSFALTIIAFSIGTIIYTVLLTIIVVAIVAWLV